MGRIRCSGSPVVRAKTKTTTDRRVRATSDCSTRNRTNRSTELINVGGSERRSSPTPPTEARSSAGPLVQEQGVHHGARGPLAERLGGRVRRGHLHHGEAGGLAAQARINGCHERLA